MKTGKAPKASKVRRAAPDSSYAPPGSAPDLAPVPRRTSRPKWLDPRIIGGLLLVIAAVVVGAKVVGASSHTTPVWAAAHDLAPGTILTAADLTSVNVNLGSNATLYLKAGPGAGGVVGHALVGTVKAGELLPLSLLSDPANGRVVVIGVAANRMPPGVGHGSKIDLYLTTPNPSGSGPSSTSMIESAITVQSVTAPASGGLSGATSSQYQVAVLLSADTADKLVRALPTGDPMVVLVSGR